MVIVIVIAGVVVFVSPSSPPEKCNRMGVGNIDIAVRGAKAVFN